MHCSSSTAPSDALVRSTAVTSPDEGLLPVVTTPSGSLNKALPISEKHVTECSTSSTTGKRSKQLGHCSMDDCDVMGGASGGGATLESDPAAKF